MKNHKKIDDIIIFSLSIAIIVAVAIPTTIAVNKRHEEKLLNVNHAKIKETARDCYLKDECENVITLQEMYNKNILEKQYDPISKEEYNSSSYVAINDLYEAEFVIK